MKNQNYLFVYQDDECLIKFQDTLTKSTYYEGVKIYKRKCLTYTDDSSNLCTITFVKVGDRSLDQMERVISATAGMEIQGIYFGDGNYGSEALNYLMTRVRR